MPSLFAACPCGAHYLARVRRRPWMRMLPWLRFYRCGKCGKPQLITQHAATAARSPPDGRTDPR
jgi:predicted SprT family Zn-dependent metalloprotease